MKLVLARSLSDAVLAGYTDTSKVLIVTPRTIARARGRSAREVVILGAMIRHPKLVGLLQELSPCLATVP